VLHNPYNVSLELKKESGSPDTAAMRVSFNGWESWSVLLEKNAAPMLDQDAGDLGRCGHRG